ncbi:MAG: hypothetical protein Gaeavirus6_15 [Gaeavirus sp.]|uniref:Uncharacterized protein n=1 Tax=Gaeavirus sp. TaxID=2487767 RepID=A0A3G4ZYV2_9VIRU|nr:MAG: hypothetical protein Gaeavirus6_15 [Gaeavirus sp.]
MSKTNPLVMQGKSVDEALTTAITDQMSLTTLVDQNLTALAAIPGFDINSTAGMEAGINGILESTPLKVGCCLRKPDDDTSRVVMVRVPYESSSNNPQLEKFGFQWGILSIPEGTCPKNLYRGSGDCDAFYDIYCGNVNAVFSETYGPNFETSSYVAYAPECACYAPRTVGEEQYPVGIPPACYKTSCTVDSAAAYPDPTSRGEPCSLTICSSIVNTAGMKAGGVANVSAHVTQKCGYDSKQEKIDPADQNNALGGAFSDALSDFMKPSFLIACVACLLIVSAIYMFTRKGTKHI